MPYVPQNLSETAKAAMEAQEFTARIRHNAAVLGIDVDPLIEEATTAARETGETYVKALQRVWDQAKRNLTKGRP